MGATSGDAAKIAKLDVSIHAPVMGATAGDADAIEFYKFQSTHP